MPPTPFSELTRALSPGSALVDLDEALVEGWPEARPWRRGALQERLVEAAFQGLAPLRTEGAWPRMIVLLGRARTGSTALMRLFGAAGIPALCQPLKNSLRHHLVGERYARSFPAGHPVLLLKTTFGPFCAAECLFDPVAALLEAGFPAQRLHLVFLDREPAECLLSWRACWGDRLPSRRLVEHFVLASLSLRRIEALAEAGGLQRSYHVHALNAEPRGSLARLFDRLGLAERFHAGLLADWAPWGSPASNLHSDPEPEPFRTPGLHDAHDGLRFQVRPLTPLPAWARQELDRHALGPGYERALLRATG